MNNNPLTPAGLQQVLTQQFAVKADIAEVVVADVPVGMAARATIFKTTNGQMLVYVESRSAQVLDDMQKTVRHMNCDIEHIYPPHGDAEYFTRIASDKFKAMFPGKRITGDDDLRYYKNITPYNPALLRVSKIKGDIRGFDEQTKLWRKVKDYSYSKITTTTA